MGADPDQLNFFSESCRTMNHPSAFPFIPGKPLDYWLNSDAARLSPETTSSGLRDMAWTFGQFRGLMMAMAGLGTTLLAGGLLALIMMPATLGLWISLIAVGLGLLGMSLWAQKAKLPAIAHSKQPGTSRAAGTIGSGVTLASGMALLACGIMALALHGWLGEGPGPAFSFFVVMLLIVSGTASVFIAPAYCIQHARRDFRRYIDKNPALRQELETLSLTWRDPFGARSFGPL